MEAVWGQQRLAVAGAQVAVQRLAAATAVQAAACHDKPARLALLQVFHWVGGEQAHPLQHGPVAAAHSWQQQMMTKTHS
jgi:hypothetical protein